MLGICMVDETEVRQIAKTKIAYQNVLLMAINDVRYCLAHSNSRSSLASLEALISVLPPEIREVVDGQLEDLKRMRKADEDREFEAYVQQYKEKHRIYGDLYEGAYHDCLEHLNNVIKPKYRRRYVSTALQLIVRVLDEHGLLRDYREEEIGSG